jgi:putative spermidine/putrescine transport system substrate-binding protein
MRTALPVVASLVLALAPATRAAEDASGLVVATFGGAYGQSQQKAYFEPFTQSTGTKISIETYDGSFGAIKNKIAATPSAYDLVDLSAGALAALCHDGLLEPIDGSILDGGQSIADDFIAGGLPSCGVGSVAWATMLAFDKRAFAKGQPSKIADLLDTRRFPGKRALPNGPRYTLELALLADGVPPENVYGELGTPAGVDRAFNALDKIKSDILWWDKGQEPVTWLLEQKAVMAAAYTGRLFRAAVSASQLDLLWDGEVYDFDVWAIPKTATNKDAAKHFIAFASDPARLAAQAQLIAYGPMRQSAIPLVGKHPLIGVEMKSYLPTAPNHLQKALRFDAAWWNEHGDGLTTRFQSWREQAATAEGTSQNTSANQPH